MMDSQYTPVIFGTLTQPNPSDRQLKRGDAERLHTDELAMFLARATMRWRVHLCVDVGYEDGFNQHSHLIIGVLTDELDAWRRNRDRFDPRRAWRWHIVKHWDDYDPNHEGDCFSYVTKKHIHLLDSHLRCPQRGKCRRGGCSVK